MGDLPLDSPAGGESTPRAEAAAVTSGIPGQAESRAGERGFDGRSETPLERRDRNLTELMGELRVALPGVQVLFGFLLVIPFDARFKSATGAERGLYFATLVLTLLASMLLIAPTIVHRLVFQRGQKAFIVDTGNQLAIAGLSTLALALTCAIAFVTDFVFGPIPATITGILAALAFGSVWYALPLRRRR